MSLISESNLAAVSFADARNRFQQLGLLFEIRMIVDVFLDLFLRAHNLGVEVSDELPQRFKNTFGFAALETIECCCRVSIRFSRWRVMACSSRQCAGGGVVQAGGRCVLTEAADQARIGTIVLVAQQLTLAEGLIWAGLTMLTVCPC